MSQAEGGADLAVSWLDAETAVVWVSCRPDKLVWLQSVFELYEGLGIVRTWKPGEIPFPVGVAADSGPQIGVITVRAQLEECCQAVRASGCI